jgi:hypothetical protein
LPSRDHRAKISIIVFSWRVLHKNKPAQQGVQADLVVRAALEPLSRRGAFFRFVGWFSHQAANASRWALHHIAIEERSFL